MSAEQKWRKAIADQIRRNCTIDWETAKKGGDALIYAVADWVENPPEWSHFDSPMATQKARVIERAYTPNRGPSDRLKAGETVQSYWSSGGALWTIEYVSDKITQPHGPLLTLRSVKSGRTDSRHASELNIVAVPA